MTLIIQWHYPPHMCTLFCPHPLLFPTPPPSRRLSHSFILSFFLFPFSFSVCFQKALSIPKLSGSLNFFSLFFFFLPELFFVSFFFQNSFSSLSFSFFTPLSFLHCNFSYRNWDWNLFVWFLLFKCSQLISWKSWNFNADAEGIFLPSLVSPKATNIKFHNFKAIFFSLTVLSLCHLFHLLFIFIFFCPQ